MVAAAAAAIVGDANEDFLLLALLTLFNDGIDVNEEEE